MNPAVVLATLLWLGAVLLLGELRWFRRPRLLARIAPYVPGLVARPTQPSAGAWSSLRQLAIPIAHAVGGRLARALGVNEELTTRLERIHSPLSATAFRLRQFGWAVGAFAAACMVVVAVRPPVLLALFLTFGAALLAHLIAEQRVASASARWQRRLFLELPVISEQLGMMLSAGYSVGGALNRLAERGHGACSTDLRRVGARIRHGLSEHAALSEWATSSGVAPVGRLVGVLERDGEANDLGRLITEESRAVRREVHRQLIETIERRSQQVWIPVTVATLVPGVLLIGVPFIAAMQLFTSS